MLIAYLGSILSVLADKTPIELSSDMLREMLSFQPS